MKAPARLSLYGLVLVAVFAVAGFTANAVIPEETVQSWAEDTADNTHHEEGDAMNGDEHEGHNAGASSLGLGLAQDGYQLTAVSAPTATGTEGELLLTVTGPDGNPVTDFELEHEKELHLIAVRADGQHFRHVHPQMNDDGTWSIPWQWEAAGSYRVFADFVPAETGEGITLSTSVQVAGDYDPVPAEPAATTSVNGFDVSVEGDLVAGSTSELTMTITRDGEPVTTLEPYLGAFGHLVALRDGDLAYLHVHPHGDAPQAGETSGPEIVFEATAPTEGRYLLYLDFQIDGQVHTAPLVIDTTGAGDNGGHSGGEHSDTEPDTGDKHEEGADHGH
ncbi:MAG: heavy-metal-associated domain-containing protein [Brevibacterium aurantiacum]|uniref:Heavy metal-binding domain-containing protein n=1 Tax=Brevibacterium aurantiacum TaxID=273384 RepID=A0A3Q9NTM1_BREAU|nr:heavy-metal-associated domain-containing protein [Brevibacterium aurantiacum]AZT94749.1 heavy metal-binding domain-containing protein [Brevibacterium aurantiacum]